MQLTLSILNYVIRRRCSVYHGRPQLGDPDDADQSLAPSPCYVAKSENWRIAREMDLDELKGTDLGQFVESL